MTPEEALAIVREHGVVLEAARGSRPSLAELIAGEPIRGSWWSHPKGREIFAITRAVRESDEVLVCRLVEGKITYVHRRLWPALVRAAERFPPERLARLREVHTSAGRHETEEVLFPDWVPAGIREAARELPEAMATAELAVAIGQEILPPDLDRIAKQRSVVDAAAQTHYGAPLPGGKADLEVLQRLVDDGVFGRSETYQLQSLGIVLGQVLADHPGLAWVTVSDLWGEDPALRYKATSTLIFPLTMVSKRVEDEREVDVNRLYEAVLDQIQELESKAD